MTLKRRQFNRDFKLQILREIEAGKSLAHVAREYQLHPTLINKWKQQHAQYPEHAFSGHGHIYKDEARIGELERMIGQLTVENAFLKKALSRLEMQVGSARRNGGRS